MEIKKLLNEITSLDAKGQFYSDVDNDLYTKVIEIDPTYNKEKDILGMYSKWLLSKKNINIIKSFTETDFIEMEKNLKLFDDNKKRLKGIDINKYTVLQLTELVSELDNTIKTKEATKASDYFSNEEFSGEVDKYSVGDYYIFQPKTQRASNYYGKNTKWCTVGNNDNAQTKFKGYSDLGKLWILIDKNNSDNKFLLHFETERLADKDDNDLKFKELLDKKLTYFFIKLGYNSDFFYDFIIRNQPELIKYLDLSSFSKIQIIRLLTSNPDIVDDFDLSNFTLTEIIRLVLRQPKFIKLLDKFNIDEFTNGNIFDLVFKYPQLAERFDLNKLDAYSIYEILLKYTDLVTKINKDILSTIEKEDTNTLINTHPQLKQYFDNLQTNIINETLKRIIKEELDNQEFMNLVDMIKSSDLDQTSLALQIATANKADKQFEDYFKISLKEYTRVFNKVVLPISKNSNLEETLEVLIEQNLDLTKIDGEHICYILREYPKLFKELDINKIDDTKDIIYLLLRQPQFIGNFDLTKLDGEDICHLIIEYPKWIHKLDTTKMDGVDIYMVLLDRPELVDKLNLNVIKRKDILHLLEYEPQLKPYFDKIKK